VSRGELGESPKCDLAPFARFTPIFSCNLAVILRSNRNDVANHVNYAGPVTFRFPLAIKMEDARGIPVINGRSKIRYERSTNYYNAPIKSRLAITARSPNILKRPFAGPNYRMLADTADLNMLNIAKKG
jgi:hypothetical protein